MINYNGNLINESENQWFDNRGFLYGDAVFETVKTIGNKVLFLEDHYFRLMSSMRILRMEIPMNFTMEFFEDELLKSLPESSESSSFRIRMTVYRNSGGFYLPKTREISYIVQSQILNDLTYQLQEQVFEVDLYKDFYITGQLLSTLKTTNRAIQISASIFAEENDLQNCILLNERKNVVEAIDGNIFMFKDNKLITPPLSEGCVQGVMRKKILELLKKEPIFQVEEAIISPFDLQKADELFVTNVVRGIRPITKYRKKEYTNLLSKKLTELLNEKFVK